MVGISAGQTEAASAGHPERLFERHIGRFLARSGNGRKMGVGVPSAVYACLAQVSVGSGYSAQHEAWDRMRLAHGGKDCPHARGIQVSLGNPTFDPYPLGITQPQRVVRFASGADGMISLRDAPLLPARLENGGIQIQAEHFNWRLEHHQQSVPVRTPKARKLPCVTHKNRLRTVPVLGKRSIPSMEGRALSERNHS